MRLRRIHLSEDRVLSNDELKFVIGGGDDDAIIDGGMLDEVEVIGHHTPHSSSDFTECPECKKFNQATLDTANQLTYGYPEDNGGVANQQYLSNYFMMAYHYIYRSLSGK